MNLKKFLILLAMLMLCFTVYKLVDTYALFETELKKSVIPEIGKWNIKVNSTDVTNRNNRKLYNECRKN